MGAVACALGREQGLLNFHPFLPHNSVAQRQGTACLMPPNSAANLGSCGEGERFRHLGRQDWELACSLIPQCWS